MDYLHGERVRILGKPEWGPGYIQGECRNGKVSVRFQQAGRKTLSLKHAKLMKVALRSAWELEQLQARRRDILFSLPGCNRR